MPIRNLKPVFFHLFAAANRGGAKFSELGSRWSGRRPRWGWGTSEECAFSREIFWLFLAKWCILAQSQGLHEQCAAYVTNLRTLCCCSFLDLKVVEKTLKAVRM